MGIIKITMLTTSFPLTGESVSGIFVRRLIEHFPENITTTVITPAGPDPATSSVGDRVNVRPFRYAPRRLQVLAQRPGGIPVALKNNKWLYFLMPSFLFSDLMSCLRYGRHSQIIHANWAINGCVAGFVGKMLKIPVVTTLRGEDVTRAQTHKFDSFLLRFCLRLSTSVVVVSEAMKTWIDAEFSEARSKTIVIENGTEDLLLKVGGQSVRSGTGKVEVLTVGSLIPRKGIDQLIMAIARAANREALHLSIVGKGPEAHNLRQLVAELGLAGQVTFVGQVAPPDIPAVLVQADIFVLASHSEGRPNVVLEAMAVGLPVIATDIDGINELITHDKNGLLFHDGSVDELTEHIANLSSDSKLRARLGQAARDFIIDRNLSWSDTGSRYGELYSSLL